MFLRECLLSAVVLCAAFTLSLAQDYAGISEILKGPINSPVICLLLHGLAHSSETWADPDTTNTLDSLSAAGILTVAIDLPDQAASPPLPDGASIDGLIPHIFNKYRTPGVAQARILVSPSASGFVSLPYVSSLSDPEELTAFVPVAPNGISEWPGAEDAAVRDTLKVHGIYGEKDTNYLPDVPILATLFPRFTSHIIPDATHLPYITNPAVFNEILITLAQELASVPLQPAALTQEVEASSAAVAIESDVASSAPRHREAITLVATAAATCVAFAGWGLL